MSKASSKEPFPYAYINKKIDKIQNAQIPVNSKAVQYGLGCFSGIRGFRDEENKKIYLFRPRDHFKRLKESTHILGMNFNLNYKKFVEILKELIQKNKIKEDIYIRTTVYAADTGITPRFDNKNDDIAIYITSLKDYFDPGKGLNTCVSSWRRFDDDMFSTKAKMTGAYANSALAKTEALRNGFDEPIFLNREGKVCEASGANIFGIKNGIVWTPPAGMNILEGITRNSLIEIIKNEMNLEVREEGFDRSMLYTFDELFLSGTAAKVAFIAKVDGRKISDGRIGKTTAKIKKLYEKATTGKLPGYENWRYQLN